MVPKIKRFHIGQKFYAPDPNNEYYQITATVIMVKSWSDDRHLLGGCQLIHFMIGDNPNCVYRVFKWANGEMNRVVKLEDRRQYSRIHPEKCTTDYDQLALAWILQKIHRS